MISPKSALDFDSYKIRSEFQRGDNDLFADHAALGADGQAGEIGFDVGFEHEPFLARGVGDFEAVAGAVAVCAERNPLGAEPVLYACADAGLAEFDFGLPEHFRNITFEWLQAEHRRLPRFQRKNGLAGHGDAAWGEERFADGEKIVGEFGILLEQVREHPGVE